MGADPDNTIRLPRQRTASTRYITVGFCSPESFTKGARERQDWYDETPHQGVRLAVHNTSTLESVLVLSPKEIDDLIVALAYYREKGVIKDETTEKP